MTSTVHTSVAAGAVMPLWSGDVMIQPQVVSVPQTVETITSSVLFSPTIGEISNFRHRLDMLRDQIALGQQQGMLSAAQATDLMSRYKAVSDYELSLASQPTITREQNDNLEQQINLLNQDVSNAMTH